MGRRSHFNADQILDAALAALPEHGAGVTVAQIGQPIGAPTGSIYHRFSSREDLLIQLWLRSIRRFHQTLFPLESLHPDPADALAALACQVAAYSREHPAEAFAMTLFRHTGLVRTAPEHLRFAVEHVNDEAFAMLTRLGRRLFPGLADGPELVSMLHTCVFGLSYGLVRPHIVAFAPIPLWMDSLIERASRAALGSAEDWSQPLAGPGLTRARQ